jgi:Protein of unknown function (DUF4058)
MPLQDHFRPPLSLRRHWHAFHNAWATYIASDLNARLPEGYFAEPNVRFGIEIDVATFEESGSSVTATAVAGSWTPPSPTLTIPFSIVTDTIEVNVFESVGGPVLAGAIELVSPANKDRPAHREAFVSKCETLLQAGLGLVVVDVVTVRGGNLHDELLQRLLASEHSASEDELSASAYRPVERGGAASLDIWKQTLELGVALPVLPLWLKAGPCLSIDLEATYERTRREQRLIEGA